MAAKIQFTSATVTRLVLAKIGHPQRDEPLQTSKQVLDNKKGIKSSRCSSTKSFRPDETC